MQAARGVAEPPEIEPSGFAPVCVLPWIHTQIETTGNVKLCCVAHSPRTLGNIHRQSIAEIFHSDEMNHVRNQMLLGVWPEDCRACRDREAMQLQSFRQSSNRNHRAHFAQLVTRQIPLTPKIRTIDLRLNNTCNFKCRSCDGFSSNRWFAEHDLIYPENPIAIRYQGFDRSASFDDDFDRHILPDLDEIHFAGGEPLIMDSHYRVLEKLIAAGKTGVRLQYDTNFSRLTFKHWDAIELWKKFTHVQISLSLDGTGRRGEYIRQGLDYAKWVENVERLRRELPNAERNLHFVVSIFNVIDFPEHYREITEGRFVDPDRITLTFLEWPEFLSAQVLTPELKRKVQDDLRGLLAADGGIRPPVGSQIRALVDFIGAKDLHTQQGVAFAEKTRALDRLRGQNALELFPALAPMFDDPAAL